MDLQALLEARRSVRDFDDRRGVDEADLVAMLRAAQGRISDGRRTTPSAKACYPLRLVVARGPDPAGTWSWDPEGGSLRLRSDVDVRPELAAAAIGEQPWVGDAPVTVVLCADVRHMVEEFADQPPGRGRRYADIEVGAAAQNLALAATARGLGGVVVGGFDDDRVTALLGLDSHVPRALFSLGHPAVARG